ncbi:MAG: class I tRNA ligase family protein [Luteolibacter sp.]
MEYKDKESPAIFVKFPLTAEAASNLGVAGASMVIWTTTPWTLPANLGVALHPEFTYVVGRFERDGHSETLVVVPRTGGNLRTEDRREAGGNTPGA